MTHLHAARRGGADMQENPDTITRRGLVGLALGTLLGGAAVSVALTGCTAADAVLGSASSAQDAEGAASSKDGADHSAASSKDGMAFSAADKASSESDAPLAAGTAPNEAGYSSGQVSVAQTNSVYHYEDIPADALISVDDLKKMVDNGDIDNDKLEILDIRSHRDYSNLLIEGSRNIPAGRQIEIRIDEIPQDRTIVLIALKNSDRLAETYYTLLDYGYDPALLRVCDGGVRAWADAGYPTLEDQFLGC